MKVDIGKLTKAVGGLVLGLIALGMIINARTSALHAHVHDVMHEDVMHELSIATSIVEIASEEAGRQAARA